MIIEDMDAQMHIWVRCTRDQTLDDGRRVYRGHRYFALYSWATPDCGPCTDPDHPDCDAGALELAGLHAKGDGEKELFCSADFEPVGEDEAAQLMASMIRGPAPLPLLGARWAGQYPGHPRQTVQVEGFEGQHGSLPEPVILLRRWPTGDQIFRRPLPGFLNHFAAVDA